MKIFGEDVHIQLTPGHIWGEIAKRIYSVRNAIVHSSEQYGLDERFVPFSRYTILIQREIPLIKVLAEEILHVTRGKEKIKNSAKVQSSTIE